MAIQPTPGSVDAVAQSILVPSNEVEDNEQNNIAVEDDPIDRSQSENDDGVDEGEDDDNEEFRDTSDSDTDNDGDDDEDVSDDDATTQERDEDYGVEDEFDSPTLGVDNDDTLLTVTVDGEEQEVTLGDLKRRYAGEGAIERRLQGATEHLRGTVELYDKSRAIIEATMKEFGQALFRRSIPAPDPSLRMSNPTEYLVQKDMYDQETAALQQANARLHELTGQADRIADEARAQQRKKAAEDLRHMMPVLSDPQKGPKARQAIVEAAKFCGFSDADIAACTEPKLFVAMSYVSKMLRMQNKSTVQAAKPTPKSIKKSGSGNRAKSSSFERQQRQAKAKAAQTGNVDDVAATMLAKAPRNARKGRR